MSDSSCIYLENKEDANNKFWVISNRGKRLAIEYGEIGGDGEVENFNFNSEEEAQQEFDKLIKIKKEEGYK